MFSKDPCKSCLERLFICQVRCPTKMDYEERLRSFKKVKPLIFLIIIQVITIIIGFLFKS